MSTLAGATWPEVERADDALLLIPVGSLEQHGPALPLETDAHIATVVARGAAERMPADPPVLVGPAVPYGASGEHQDFPGTVSVGSRVLAALLVELGRSACTWAGRLVFVNGHGGNVVALAAACRRLRYEARDVAWTHCRPEGGDAHAGHTETSILLATAPRSVRTEQLLPGNTTPLPELLPTLVESGVREVSANGVLGDPTGAGADAGRRIVGQLVTDLVRELRDGSADDDGRLRVTASEPAG